jgi:polysaccharide pyruvyl transferase WcaK-like protein
VAERVDLITVRDSDSADLLRQIGVRRPPIQITADPVLAWAPESLNHPRPTAQLDSLVISVRPWAGGETYLRAIAGAADRAVRAWGVTPVLLPFAAGTDESVCRRVRELMAEGGRAIILPDLPPAKICDAVAGAGLVLGMRLHSLILAAVAGVPLVGLAYDPKVASFLRSLDLEDLVCPLQADAETIWRSLQAARARRARFAADLADRLPALRERALATARLALGLIEGKSSSPRAGSGKHFAKNQRT